jgi:hypothetical protein
MDVNPTTTIAARLIDHFSEGITAGDDIISFAESALGISSTDEFIAVLGDGDCYGGGLYDLIFAPGSGIRIALEPLIPCRGLSAMELEEIAEFVLAGQGHTLVTLGNDGSQASITLVPSILRKFVSNLNMNRPLNFPDPESCTDASRIGICTRLRVIMRNARVNLSAAQEEFLQRMLAHMIDDDRCRGDTILDSLEFMLSLFSEGGGDSDLQVIISWKKASCRKMLESASQFEEMTRRYSMEYLMSMRIQPPAIDPAELRKSMYYADLISMTVFGRPADDESADGTMIHYDTTGTH